MRHKKPQVYRRAVKLSLKWITGKKRLLISNLVDAYRGAVNFYIRSLWTFDGALDKETLARLDNTRLSERYKSQALKQALECVSSTRKSAKALGVEASLPYWKGSLTLDAKFVSIEQGEGSFDLMIKLSTLNKGGRIWIPTRKTAVLNKWLKQPLAKLVQGCTISKDRLTLFVELPKVELREKGLDIGIDLGVNKLLTVSDGLSPTFLGTKFRGIRNKINRRKPGSAGRRRAYAERDNFINNVINQLPWSDLRTIGLEDLRGIKFGKQKKRGKSFRKALAPWVVRRVQVRIEQKAEENRVLVKFVSAAYTSRTCPRCKKESKENRRGENFRCVACAYGADADFVGATNILERTLLFPTSVESVGPKMKPWDR